MRAENDFLVDGRRAELGDFLRRRRAELTTDVVGLPSTRRRRTPGLRREEVAELANISAALYAWLEQGRDVPISRRTVDAIANALQFSPSERDHIHALATSELTDFDEEVSATLERMVGSQRTHPIFVLDHNWDVVLINRPAHMIFHYDGDRMPYMNVLQSTFDEKGRTLFVNWHEVAECLVELFRFDYALYAADVATLALVDRLRATDRDFSAIWDEHRVRRAPSAICRLNNREGVLSVEPSIYAVLESPGLRCMIFTPADAETERRLDRLVSPAAAEPDVALVPAAIRLR